MVALLNLNGIQIDPEKIKLVKNYPRTANIK